MIHWRSSFVNYTEGYLVGGKVFATCIYYQHERKCFVIKQYFGLKKSTGFTKLENYELFNTAPLCTKVHRDHHHGRLNPNCYHQIHQCMTSGTIITSKFFNVFSSMCLRDVTLHLCSGAGLDSLLVLEPSLILASLMMSLQTVVY